MFTKADVGHVVGSFEQRIMLKRFPGKPIRNIPLYIYKMLPENIEKDFSKRKDIVFVSGFNHAPNKDGVIWFAKEVFPKVVEKYPDIIWHIVGSNVPDEIIRLGSRNIKIDGFLSDEQLEALYRSCRLAVVPLRYGAGVKGKVVEAAYNQIPLVTTSIGGEGLDKSVGAFLVEDDAMKMSVVINAVYSDFNRLRKISDSGKVFIEKYFTLDRAKEVILEDMGD